MSEFKMWEPLPHDVAHAIRDEIAHTTTLPALACARVSCDETHVSHLHGKIHSFNSLDASALSRIKLPNGASLAYLVQMGYNEDHKRFELRLEVGQRRVRGAKHA